MERRDFVKTCAVVGGGLAMGAAGFLLGRTASGPDSVADPPAPITWRAGGTITIADLDAATNRVVQGVWDDLPVVILALPVSALRAASLLRGRNTGQFALVHPDDAATAITVYDGRCTHLGCTIGFAPELGASRDTPDYDGDGRNDGRFMCPCHQSQFDAFDLGTDLPAQPAQRPIGIIRFRLENGAFMGLERIEQSGRYVADRAGRGAGFQLAG